MSKIRHTLVPKKDDICELEKWGLCKDAVNWPRSWWKIILKFFVCCGTLAFSSFWCYKMVSLGTSPIWGVPPVLWGVFGFLWIFALGVGLIKTANNFRRLVSFFGFKKAAIEQIENPDNKFNKRGET